MPGSLKEETALLLEDYFQHRAGGAALPPSATAAELRRAAAELERRERPFFRSCAPLARAEPREAAALLRKVAAQLEAEGGLNWGRLLALVVFTGTLAAALAESGCEEGPSRLAAALAAYLAEEQGEWLEEHGGWVSGAAPGPGAGAAPGAERCPRAGERRGWGPGAGGARRGAVGAVGRAVSTVPRPPACPRGPPRRGAGGRVRRAPHGCGSGTCESLGWLSVPRAVAHGRARNAPERCCSAQGRGLPCSQESRPENGCCGSALDVRY